MFSRILVPVDGSTFSEHALPFAAHAARTSGAALMVVLVHARQSPVTTDLVLREAVDAWEDARVRQETDYLNELAGRIERELGIAVRHQILSGEVVPALEREVRVHDVDLVVMTTHGRAGLARAWLGSVADALVRTLEVPVLLVRPDDGPPPDRLADGGYRHVLLALDGSERAERAIEPALALAPGADTRITLLRTAAPPAAITSPYLPHAARFTHEEMERSRAAAEEYLAGAAAPLKDRGRDVHTVAAVDYHAARAIIRFADENDVDLIAMGTHGRSPVTRLVLGSTSDKVVRSASVPVLVC
jgi:nucleotide-binding universal stress UspA family protein